MARKSKSQSRQQELTEISGMYKPNLLIKKLLETEYSSGNEATPLELSRVMPQSTVTERKPMSDVASIIEYDDDLSNAEAPVPIPPGDYAALIRGAERKKAKSGDKEYANVTFYISSEQYPADYTEGDADGTILSYGMGRLSTAGDAKSRWNMKRFCENIGSELGRILDLNAWLDKSAIVTVVNEEYEGQMQAKISKVGPA